MLFGRRRSVSRGQASGWRRRASRGVFEVDCLVEPGAEEVVYPRSCRSLDRMRTPVWKLPGYGIMPARVDQFAGKAIHNGLKLANMNTCREPNRMPDQRLTNSSRKRGKTPGNFRKSAFQYSGSYDRKPGFPPFRPCAAQPCCTCVPGLLPLLHIIKRISEIFGEFGNRG